MGVEVDLDAEELAGVGDGIERQGEAVGDGEDAGLVPEVEQAFEGDVEEVAGAAGGIEDADAGELGGPVLQESESGAVELEEGLAGGWRSDGVLAAAGRSGMTVPRLLLLYKRALRARTGVLLARRRGQTPGRRRRRGAMTTGSTRSRMSSVEV